MGTRPPLEYLATCSKVSLEAFELSRLNETANLRKEVRQILNGWIESEVDARIARWILDSKQSQAEHRDRRPAAMKQPVPLKQLDLSFLPQGGAATANEEEIENADEARGAPLRQRATKALPSGAARAPAKQRDSEEVKTGAKLLEKHGGANHGDKPPSAPVPASAAADATAKPPFAQDEENALHDLEYFVRDRKKALTAHARNAVAGGDSRLFDEMPRLAGRTAAQSPRDAAGGHAEVRVSISALAQVLPVAAEGRRSSPTARLPAHRLTPRCRPALARLSRREVQSGAFCVMRVASAS